jgi:hypothetical protein
MYVLLVIAQANTLAADQGLAEAKKKKKNARGHPAISPDPTFGGG